LRIFSASATPTPITKLPPRVPLSPKIPREGSTTCITPPFPRLVPPSLKAMSQRIFSGGRPRAIQ
jgi:hypothetical protein